MEITQEALKRAIINIKTLSAVLDKADNENVMMSLEITKAYLAMDAIKHDYNVMAQQLGIEDRA